MANDPRFPIGKFHFDGTMTEQKKEQCLDEIEKTPARLRAAVRGLDDQQLDTPYRDGGWTVRQVVHHVPDSHMNAVIRLRLALTENNPTIKTYEESEWAKLADAKPPIAVSQTLLDVLHERWDVVWRAVKEADFARPLVHPDSGQKNIDWLLFIYEWHGKHHTAHIPTLRTQKSW